MAKPTQLPRWATGGSAKVTPEPTEGKKDLGWVSAERPPEAYQNWFMLRVYQWLVYLDGLTNEALTWAAKHTFSAGLASNVAPSAATDVVRKTELDAEATARATHEGLTNPHSAASAATASRLVLRDANGRAQFADPAAAQDAATKAYVDALQFAAPTIVGATLNGSWTGTVGYWKDRSGVVHLLGPALWGAGTLIFTLPTGFRPAAIRNLAVASWNGSAYTPNLIQIQSNGTVSVLGSGAAGYQYWLDTSFLAEQ